MSVSVLVLLVLVVALAAVTPTWGYSRNWGYAPTGLVGTILLIVIILMLLGQL
jgi:hypothetical protein